MKRLLGLALTVLLTVAVCGCGGSGGGGDVELTATRPDSTLASISSAFDLTGAVGLAIDSSHRLKKVNADNSVSDIDLSDSVMIQNFLITTDDVVYLSLQQPVESCILLKIEDVFAKTGAKVSCVDSSLVSIYWDDRFNDPVQADGNGNIYYIGIDAAGRTVLRSSLAGKTIDLMVGDVALDSFLVLHDGTVLVLGGIVSAHWIKVINPARAIADIVSDKAKFISIFPDNNVYLGMESSDAAVERFLAATYELDSMGWIGKSNSHHSCPADDCSENVKLISETSDGKVYFVGSSLMQVYPETAALKTSISDIATMKPVSENLILGGVDSGNINRLILYNTTSGSELDLLSGENIKVEHVNCLNFESDQAVLFDGLRLSDNNRVLCRVNVQSNSAPVCSELPDGGLLDLQVFNDATKPKSRDYSVKTYTIGGVIVGLHGSLVIQNNLGDTITKNQNGAFTFPVAVSSSYSVSILSQPIGQTCALVSGNGILSDINIKNVSVVCTTMSGVVVTVAKNVGSGMLKNDSAGNIYFINSFQVKKMDADGVVTTVAGSGSPIFSGDSGLAIQAGMIPTELAVDLSGNVYVYELNKNTIRKIDKSSGIITTIAGNGSSVFSGDGGLSTNAGMTPVSLACDQQGNLYVVGNNRVRKIDKSSGIITTIAGNGSSVFLGDGGLATNAGMTPYGIAFDSSDNLYVAGDNRVRRIDKASGLIETIAGNGSSVPSGDGGPAINAGMRPSELLFDASGELYITTPFQIRKINKASGIVTAVAGNGLPGIAKDGSAAIATGMSPNAIAIDLSGNLFFSDASGNLKVIGK